MLGVVSVVILIQRHRRRCQLASLFSFLLQTRCHIIQSTVLGGAQRPIVFPKDLHRGKRTTAKQGQLPDQRRNQFVRIGHITRESYRVGREAIGRAVSL
jgi:hypothetical protein